MPPTRHPSLEGGSVPTRFDPFTHRLARDVRNTLSVAFARSLVANDPNIFEAAAADWLARLAHDGCRRYVTDRRDRYRKAFRYASGLAADRLLEQTAVLWNQGLYFEVHEVVERAFHAAVGDYREFLRGLILAAGVFVHQEAGRHDAARSLAEGASRLLVRHRRRLGFITDPEAFIDGLRHDPPRPVRI